jgi:hypothetical protein
VLILLMILLVFLPVILQVILQVTLLAIYRLTILPAVFAYTLVGGV